MPKGELYTTRGKVLISTLKARKVWIESADEEMWLPITQLELDELPEDGNIGEITMTAWIAKEKGLI